MPFDGQTYTRTHDQVRLTGMLKAVRDLMADGTWRTLDEIHKHIARGTESSVSARLRDLRKAKFGGLTVERRRKGEPSSGLFEYRVVVAGVR